MLHAVIMAGGSGTRFWPASRAALPKQLLQLVGQRTMIQSTVDRLEGLVPAERTLIVTNDALLPAMREQLPELPASALIGEPCKRDTAPCIGLAAAHLLRDDPAATMAVMPADHVIAPLDRFQATLKLAAALVEEQPSRIVTFGIRPTFPAETFGYIEAGEVVAPVPGHDDVAPIHRVTRFREKPEAADAKRFVEAGNFFWNSGIFVWRAATIRDALQERQPQMHAHLEKIAAAIGTPEHEQVLRTEFAAIEGISIDYAVMEHAQDVVMIEAPYQWDDVGSWQAMARLEGADADGNTIDGQHLGLETTGSIIRTDDEHLVVTLGIKDCIVVHTPDATLVADKHSEESIRKLVRLMVDRGLDKYL